MTVTREGDFTESGLDVMEEINIFEGAENRITFQQVYSKTLKCVYQLQLYPFDTQVLSLTSHAAIYFQSLQLCTVDMEIRELERSTVNLVPEMVFMESDTILVQYIVSDWSLQLRSESFSCSILINPFSYS